MSNTLQRVIKVIRNVVKADDDIDISGDTEISSLLRGEIPQIAAIDKAEIMMDLEQEFGIEITENEAYECKKVADLVSLVEEKIPSPVG